ncbi:dihydroxyacetone kinase [Friedmanniella endophytica]|uniref:Dihydroxyacetone kinase n=1 Tax=Microlunatus kandeliicorticis TaxID=1759536 RepID=A0A7W3IQW9_9ACTN|nr:dihydroxyacetone kinase family protein [Microlunatus kandeliicorticis]MBA8793568.1 dihydroxyacetone kinase [Microlunatus kandeliicorticis]
MTRLYNDPARFTEDMVAGFADANADYVVAVPGGVVRATRTPANKVAVVVGGGSGHYPAFCGVVGPGFADGAVIGNIFTSPSAADAASVARAADGGAGVLLTTGNYAGDVMNFGLAVQQLEAEGVAARYLAVTDDIASAPAEEITKRRGIAGDFTVFKVASAAAEEGADLDAVLAAGQRANDMTRSLGVAFDGCTMPGADEPLFTVPEGKMGLGLGIHGEPGVSEHAMPSAAELAELLVDGVLAEKPDGAGDRVAVILNGLGTTKYEELFVVWGRAAARLRDAGCTLVRPEVGELVTSLDMAGCSLTVMWLDDDLERWWLAAADTPTFRRGVVGGPGDAGGERRTPEEAAAAAEAPEEDEDGDDDSWRAGERISAAVAAIADAMAEHEEELGRIDAVAGDGDHGRGMVKGSAAARKAAAAAVEEGRGARGVLKAAGDEWAAQAGGTSGVLWGAALTAIGHRLGNEGTPGDRDVVEALTAGYEALTSLGGAEPGDKTMLDAWQPFVRTLEEKVSGGADWRTAWAEAVEVARGAAEDTAELRPKVGRARPLADRSVGTPDAGATSFAICVRVAGEALGTGSGRTGS